MRAIAGTIYTSDRFHILPWLHLENPEVRRPGKSYTETMRAMRREGLRYISPTRLLHNQGLYDAIHRIKGEPIRFLLTPQISRHNA